MNTNFLAKSAMLASAVTLRARAESGSGASPAKDNANTANNANDSNGNGNGNNGNGNGHADADSSKSKKKKKNKKRNSRSSLTAEDSVSAVEDGDETEESLSAAPSPVVAANTNNGTPTAVTSHIEWTKLSKEDMSPPSSLLDLPSPVPVSSGSPFDVFDTRDPAIGTNEAASAVVVPPSAPVADAASAPPAVDLADLFGSPVPAQASIHRAPPPPPPAPIALTEPTFTASVPPQQQTASPEHEPEDGFQSLEETAAGNAPDGRRASIESELAPTIDASIEPYANESIAPNTMENDQFESPSPLVSAPLTVAEPDPASDDLEPPLLREVSTSPEPLATSNVIQAIGEDLPSPPTETECVASAPTERFNAGIATQADGESRRPPSPSAVPDVAESNESFTPSLPILSGVAMANTVPDATEEASRRLSDGEGAIGSALPGDLEGATDSEGHLDTSFEAELAALVASPSLSPASSPTSIAVENTNIAVQSSPQVTAVPPRPVVSKAHTSKSPSVAARSSKSVTNGTSTTDSKSVATKTTASTKQAKTPPTITPALKAAVSRTPTKQPPKPPVASPSAATVAPKATAAKLATSQRSLSTSTAVKKPAKSPTTSTPTRTMTASPTPAHPLPDDTEPKVVKKKLSASEIDAAGNRLYEQAMESKRRLEAKKALREEEFSFTPQVNPKSKKLENTDAPNRFVMLHERAKEAQRKKDELREKLEKEECTFKPQITNKAKKITSTSDKPRFENLYRNASEIQAKREEKKKQELEKNEEELTFKPKIKASKSPVRSRPLYDPELVKQRRLEVEQKKMEAEQLAKPKVFKKKATADDGDNKIFDRLYQGGQQRTERLAKLKQDREDQEKASTTFQPKVSSGAAAGKPSTQPFHQRLYDKDYLKKVAAEREQKKIEEEKRRFSFKPRVSDMPDSAKSKGSSDGGSTGKSSIFERLYQDKDRVKEKIEMSEELKIQKEMEECTFRPHIDPPSSVASKGEPTTPIWERLMSIDKNQIADERDRLKAQLELDACTFRPEIAPTPGSISPKRASSSNIFERLSTSAGNTPVDEKKRRPSERKSIVAQGKRNSYNERGSAKEHDAQRRALSVGDILKSSKLGATHEDPINEGQPAPRSAAGGDSGPSKTVNGSATSRASEETDNVARSLEMELNEPDVLSSQSKSILENYDNWAAGLEEKMRKL